MNAATANSTIMRFQPANIVSSNLTDDRQRPQVAAALGHYVLNLADAAGHVRLRPAGRVRYVQPFSSDSDHSSRGESSHRDRNTHCRTHVRVADGVSARGVLRFGAAVVPSYYRNSGALLSGAA